MASDGDNSNKILYYVAGAAVILGAGGLLYYVFSDDKVATKNNNTKTTKTSTETAKKKKKTTNENLKFMVGEGSKSRFLDLNLCPGPNGHRCFVTSDVKNTEKYKKIKTGSQLVSINYEPVGNKKYAEILDLLENAEHPITAEFLQIPELEKKWNEAEQLKIQANEIYKDSKAEDRFAQAAELYGRAIEKHDGFRKEYYGNQVLMYFKTKNYQDALENTDKFAILDPQGSWQRGFYLRAMSLQHLKRYEEAVEAFRKAIDVEPTTSLAKKMEKYIKTCQDKLSQRVGGVEASSSVSMPSLSMPSLSMPAIN